MKNNYKKQLDEILNKKFSKNFVSGYDPLEVDMFFDNVRSYLVKNYQVNVELLNKIKKLEEEINNLNNVLSEKISTINVLNSEIESYRLDGYQSQKVVKEISFLKSQVEILSAEKEKKDKDEK